jgi:hypothetical protein
MHARGLAAGIDRFEDDFLIGFLEGHDKYVARNQNAQKTLIRVFLRPRMLLDPERAAVGEDSEDILEGYASPLLETLILALVPGNVLCENPITSCIQCQTVRTAGIKGSSKAAI